MTTTNSIITVTTFIKAPIEKIWECWTLPHHITQWTHASHDWHAPRAINDLSVDGRFTTRMESKDGTIGFDFNGTYTEIELHKKIAYTIEGGRSVVIEFTPQGDGYTITEKFEAETENPLEMQRAGWQAILDNFKNYVTQLV